MTAFSSIIFVSLVYILGSAIATQNHSSTAKEASSGSVSPSAHQHHKKHTKIVDGNVTEIEDEGWEYENQTHVDTRRVLYGRKVAVGKRPYMVYLHLTKESAKIHKYRGWLCGGVIVHPYYVLTSAACVEDADHFYVVSGTTKFIDSFDYKKDECVCKHRRRVVWKCVPKNYKFDFQDSIKWSSNDIAIVKVDKCFKFGQKEKGCQFATQPIPYNNISRELERSNTKGWIAGWGSMGNFREGVYRRQGEHYNMNAKYLQEAKVCLMDNEACAKKWAQRFRPIIKQYMICTRDVMRRLSEICDKKYANCTEIELSRRRELDEEPLDVESETQLDLGRHLREPDSYGARRASMQGGFCENDHGGPLIVKYQNKDRAIGVISACKIDPRTHSCHGPFLYTSIFKNRQFISCSIYKDVEESCRRVFRTGVTHEEYTVDWSGVEDDNVYEGDRAEQDGDENKKSKANPGSDDDDDDDNSTDEKDDKDDDSDEKEDKEALREAIPEKKEKKAKKAKKEAEKKSASESEETTETEKAKKKVEKKEEGDKQEKMSKKKTKKRKSKRSKNLRSEKTMQSYESSKDDKVNEPDE